MRLRKIPDATRKAERLEAPTFAFRACEGAGAKGVPGVP